MTTTDQSHSTWRQSPQSCPNTHWSASRCATALSSASQTSSIMSEAGGWAVAPWATPARNLQPQAEDHPINHPISNILLFSPNPKYAVACCPPATCCGCP